MSRRYFNWTYKDVRKVLEKHGFWLSGATGSHHFYTQCEEGQLFQVTVQFHGSKVFKPRTLKSMIVQSGLTKEDWGV